MKELNLFIKEGCDYCKQIDLPDNLKINVIDIDKDYNGFRPVNVPVLQFNGMNFEGPGVIGNIIHLVNLSQDGNYKR